MTSLPQYDDTPGVNPSSSLHDQVQSVIERIRPAVQSDGGDVELVELTDKGVARIRLHGACIGCPSSSMTLQMGIERNLQDGDGESLAPPLPLPEAPADAPTAMGADTPYTPSHPLYQHLAIQA